MTDLERRLSSLLERAAPEPPRLLDVETVRRRGRRPLPPGRAVLVAVATAVVAATTVPLLLVRGGGVTVSPAAHDRWSQTVRLEGGRLAIDPAQDRDTSSRKRSNVIALLLSGSQNHTPTIVIHEVKFGRVTVHDASNHIVGGFDERPAWTVVYYTGPGATSCPAQLATPAATTTPPSGTFAGAQVFILADDGTALEYSQPASWFCGRPSEPTVLPVLQRVSVPWRASNKPGVVVASIPSCVVQPQDPLPVQRTVHGRQVLAIYAFAPYPPARCESSTSREVLFSSTGLAHAPTVPVDCTRPAGKQPEFPTPDGCTLVGSP